MIQPFVGGVETVAEDALHAAILLVEREDLVGQFALGCGSIVSRDRIITAAHVVRDAILVHAGYYRNRVAEDRFFSADSVYVQPIQHFVDESLDFDIAIIIFPTNSFPSANVITIAAAAPTSGAAFVAGYGFQDPKATEPSLLPLLATLTVSSECTESLNATESHFCAITDPPAVLCPGDGGAGLYTGSGSAKLLVSTKSIYICGKN